MKNAVVSFEPKDAFRSYCRKENKPHEELAVIATVNGKYETPVMLRCYFTDTRVYSVLWIRSNERYATGTGWAGGYGYHKASAAAQEAIERAGFKMERRIDGVGDEAIRGAVDAIARHLGYDNFTIHKSNG